MVELRSFALRLQRQSDWNWKKNPWPAATVRPHPTHSLLQERGEVLAIENPESLLQRFDLLLPLCHPVLVGVARLDALGLQLRVIFHGARKLLLRTSQIGALVRQGSLLVGLLGGLVVDVAGLRGLVHLGVTAELSELLRGLLLLRGCLRLEARKVRRDHLNH